MTQIKKASPLIDEILRVDHAGEYGAARIYEGQLAVLGKGAVGDTIRHMKEQEQHHLDTFNKLIPERGARPTVLHPLWHVAGYALGVGSALLGPKAAMACTVAVEEVIQEHYQEQIDQLPDEEKALKQTLQQFRDEEEAHHDTGVEHGGRDVVGYPLMRAAIRAGSKTAIALSKRF